MIRLPPSPTLEDPWSSFDDDDNDNDDHRPIPPIQGGPRAGPSRSRTGTSGPGSGSGSSSRLPSSSSASRHPLHSTSPDPDIDHRDTNGRRYPGLGDLSDVSRPALRRLTSETERQVAESSRSGSERGSLDLLRMSVADPGAEEVEVLIHHVSGQASDRR
jgi:hypothetical protein